MDETTGPAATGSQSKKTSPKPFSTADLSLLLLRGSNNRGLEGTILLETLCGGGGVGRLNPCSADEALILCSLINAAAIGFSHDPFLGGVGGGGMSLDFGVDSAAIMCCAVCGALPLLLARRRSLKKFSAAKIAADGGFRMLLSSSTSKSSAELAPFVSLLFLGLGLLSTELINLP